MSTVSHLPFWRRVERFRALTDWDIFDLIWVFTGRY